VRERFRFTPRRSSWSIPDLVSCMSGKRPSQLKIEWGLEFNYEVSPEELEKNLSLTYDEKTWKKDINFTIRPDRQSRRFSIVSEPIERTDEERSITLVVSKNLKSTAGPLGLATDIPAQMKVETDLKLYSVSSAPILMKPVIRIEFSSPVDPELAKEYISLDPSIDFRIEQHHRSILLTGEFEFGNWYKVSVKEGLLGNDGTILRKDFSQRVKIEDLESSLAFQAQGLYLPGKSSRTLAIETVNTDTVRVEIEKIYVNNLIYLLQRSGPGGRWNVPEGIGRRIFSEDLVIDPEKNRLVVTPIDLGGFYDTGEKGIYRVVVRDNDNYWNDTSILAHITDLGIVAQRAEDDLFVWVNSLESLNPQQGVEVTLFSRTNQVIASASTNSKGIVLFEDLVSKMKAEDYEPFTLTVKRGDDISFLEFGECRMPLSAFDIGGRKYLTSGYEAYIYPDRDIFRPGDTIHIAAIVRGEKVSSPPSFPVNLKILDPTSRIFRELTGTPDESGMLAFTLGIPDYAKTGRYVAKLHAAEEEIGRMDFNVEDFIPDKIKVILQPTRRTFMTGDRVDTYITGTTLFGPPASGRKVEAALTIRSHPFLPSEWRDFTFGDPDRKFSEIELETEEGILDEDGIWGFSVDIPGDIFPAAALKGVLSATVTEHGGRAVSAYTDIDIHPYPLYIGLRPKTEGYAKTGEQFEIDYVTVNPEGEEIGVDTLNVEVYRIVYQSILERGNDNRYRYVSERSDELQTSFDIDTRVTGSITYTPERYGRYKIVLRDPDSKASSAMNFYTSGWGYAPWSLENPDRVEIEIEKESYRVGETATLLVKAPFPGKLLLMVEREKVFDYRVIDMGKNTATISLLVSADYAPNAYVTATVIKPISSFDGKSPLRAFGVAPLQVDNTAKRLSLDVGAPEAIRPGTQLDIDVKVTNLSGTTSLTVSAVDEGICQLTDFKTPDPFGFFYGKKRLGVEYFDVFSLILPEYTRSGGQPAGDYIEKVRKKHLNPVGIRRIKPTSLWSGIVKTDASGRAKVTLDVPQFQGKLRVMVVAANSSYTGSSRRDVYVRDLIVLTPTFPRFIASKDEFTVPVTVYNGTGTDSVFKVSLAIDGPVDCLDNLEKTIRIRGGKEGFVSYRLSAEDKIGKASFLVTATGAGETSSSTTDVPVRPSSPVTTLSGSEVITEVQPLELTLPGDFIEGTQEARLIFSSFPAVKFTGSLQYLLRYPHGCIEQTTSRVFPLLYFDELARVAEPELFEANDAGYYVQEGIDKLTSMQQDNGGFSFWPGGNYQNKWGSIYASHFLVEARKAGYQIPERVYKNMLSNLEHVTRGRFENRYELQQQVYACYVMALAEKPQKSTVKFIRENRLKDIPASSQFQLALSFWMMGDERTARSLLPTEVHPIDVKRETGRNFNSSVRENAIMLDVLAEVYPDSPGIPVLVERLSKQAGRGRWSTTQDNAFALLAIGKVYRQTEESDYTAELLIDGVKHSSFDESGLTLEDSSLPDRTVTVNLTGEGRCYLYWQLWGVPERPEYDEYDRGISVSREYLDIDGNHLDYQNVRHGELVIAKITMQALDNEVKNVIVDDMLPAGFEIENPRLESRAQIPWIGDQGFSPDYLDMRDDRLHLYTSLKRGKPKIFYYALRAVTRGRFTLPPITAECMYDPTYTSIKSSGSISVGH